MHDQGKRPPKRDCPVSAEPSSLEGRISQTCSSSNSVPTSATRSAGWCAARRSRSCHRLAGDRDRLQHRSLSIVDALLLRPLPVERPDRIVDVYTKGARRRHLRDQFVPRLPRLPGRRTRSSPAWRLQPGDRRGEGRRPVAHGARRGRHRQLLPAARRQRVDRTDAAARRRSARRAARRRPVAPDLDARLRPATRRSSAGRCTFAAEPTPSSASRRHVHGHGADAAAGDVAAAGVGRGGRAGRASRTSCRRRPATRGSNAAASAGCSSRPG